MGACGGKTKSTEIKKIKNKKPKLSDKVESKDKTMKENNQDKKFVEKSEEPKDLDNVEVPSRPQSRLIDFDILLIIDEVEAISDRIVSANPNALVDVANPHLEKELLQLVYGNPEKEYQEDFFNESKVPAAQV